MKINNTKLKVKKGDVFWCSSADKFNFQKKTRPFLVIQNGSKLQPNILCVALTSNLNMRRGNVLLNDYALKKESIALCDRIFKINKDFVHGYIVTISRAELRKVEIKLKLNQPKVSRY